MSIYSLGGIFIIQRKELHPMSERIEEKSVEVQTYELIEEYIREKVADKREDSWNGELHVTPKPRDVFSAADALLQGGHWVSTENYPVYFFCTDGNTKLGVRYAQDGEEIDSSAIEVVTQPAESSSRRFTPLMRLSKKGNVTQKYLVDKGEQLKASDSKRFLENFADIVAAVRWEKVFQFTNREDGIVKMVESSLEQREKALKAATEQLEADKAMFEQLKAYYGKDLPAQLTQTARLVSPRHRVIDQISETGDRAGKTELTRRLLEQTAQKIGTTSMIGCGVEISIDAGLKAPLSYNAPADVSFQRFIKDYTQVYLETAAPEEQ